jgi:N-acetylmuramoyl-L-alanine amidase
MKICIDPGHGGKDSGAIGPTGLYEKDVNLAVALILGAQLVRMGVQVIYTRTTDEYVSLKQRTDFANSQGVDYLISVHCNSFNATSKGTETWCFAAGKPGESLAKSIQTALIAVNGLTDRGVKYAGDSLHMIRETKMPATLTELAFISNPTEEALLRDPGNQKKYALAMALGVSKALGLLWVTEQPVSTQQPTVKPIIQECPVGYDEFLPGRRIIHFDAHNYISIEENGIYAYSKNGSIKII